MPPTFPCPTCQRPLEWTADAKWRPFCSERCRLIDLGDWINEKHAIPGEPVSPHLLGDPRTMHEPVSPDNPDAIVPGNADRDADGPLRH